MFCTGSDAETRLEDGRHHPRAEEGDQDHEHGAVHAHDGLAAGADWTYRADAGRGRICKKTDMYTPDGTFSRFISHLRLVKSPQKEFAKRRQRLNGDWMNLLSVSVRQTHIRGKM